MVMHNVRFGLLLTAAFLSLGGIVRAQDFSTAFIKGLTIPFYGPDNASPNAVLSVKKIFREYQRKGFFRIGLLPVVIADGIDLRVKEIGFLPNILREIEEWGRQMGDGRPVKFRRITFTVEEGRRLIVRGETLEVKPGLLAFHGTVTMQAGAHSFEAETLQIKIRPNSQMVVSIPQLGSEGNFILTGSGKLQNTHEN